VIICRSEAFPLRRIGRCFNCKRRRRIAGLDAAWYGAIWTCCACGDSWADGEVLPRPFKPRWREEATKQARATWDEAGRYTREEHRAWLRAEVGF
jgi:hypothetical protein